MSVVITSALNALTLISILMLVGIGLAVIFGLMGVINLSHGDFVTLGAFSVAFVQSLGGGFWAALLIAPFVGAAFGWLVERLLVRHLYVRPLATILAQDAIRLPELVPLRHGRMSVSPWTYYRGAAAVMAADLATAPSSGIEVQLCGDAHVLNFGLWATPERNLSFDLRDFDETLPGPFEWDVLRFAASLVVVARTNGLPAATGDDAVAAALASYRERIAHYATAPQLEIWYDSIYADQLLDFFEGKQRKRVSKIIEKGG